MAIPRNGATRDDLTRPPSGSPTLTPSSITVSTANCPPATLKLYVYAVYPNKGRANGTKFFSRYAKRHYCIWQQCLVSSLRDNCVPLAHMPAEYPVTYRKLSQLQSSNAHSWRANIAVTRGSYKFVDEFVKIQQVKCFGTTGSILRLPTEIRFARHLHNTTVTHKFCESMLSLALRPSRSWWKNNPTLLPLSCEKLFQPSEHVWCAECNQDFYTHPFFRPWIHTDVLHTFCYQRATTCPTTKKSTPSLKQAYANNSKSS